MTLAAEYGMEEGVAPWLVLRRGNTWVIQNITLLKPSGLGQGQEMHIDGMTGELLEDLGWDEG